MISKLKSANSRMVCAFRDVGIRGKLMVLVGVFVLGIAAFSAVAFTTLNSVEIGSRLYDTLETEANVLADFSPPRASLLPANLLIYRMMVSRNLDDIHSYMKKYFVAKREFESRRKFWLSDLPEGRMKDLMKKAVQPADQLFTIIENELFPLLEAGKTEQANQRRHDRVLPLFLAHQQAVDQFVRLAERQLQDERAAAQATVARRYKIMAAMLFGCVVVGGILAWLIALEVASPVLSMASVMRRMAARDMNASAEIFVARTDEIGLMAAAVQTFRDNMLKADQLTAEQVRQHETEVARARRVDELTRNFESGIGSVLQTVTSATQELTGTSSTMASAANQAASQAATVAIAAEQASSNVQSVSDSTDRLSLSIREITHRTTETRSVTETARSESQKVNQQVQTLTEAAQRIGEVVKLINNIASQTNLLALNATIEAARAGDAGQGFAVVANEVKELARQTAKATDDISHQIAGVQRSTQDAASAINGITAIIEKVFELSVSTASSVEEQEAATREIARNVQQAAEGARDVTANLTGVTEIAEKTGSAAAVVHNAAGKLHGQAQLLRALVTEFLSDVKLD